MADAPSREILITEVTRMSEGTVCVAGIDLATGQMVRPLQPDGRNWEEAKWVETYLHVGSVVRLLHAADPGHPVPPHGREDFRVLKVGFVRQASPSELYQACVDTADTDLADIVGDELIEGKYVNEGEDCRSLGCLLIDGADLRFSGKYDKVQVSWRDAGIWHNLKVTDLATSKRPDTVAEAARLHGLALKAGAPIALRLGLARPWWGPEKDWNPKRCTLQLNGLIFPA